MGMNPVQELAVYRGKKTLLQIPHGYELRVKGRFAKLATKLWEYLITKGVLVQSYIPEEKIERVRIDGRDLFDKIDKQYRALLQDCSEPEMVIVGRDTFRQMMSMRELSEYMGGPLSFIAQGARNEIVNRHGETRRTLFNLPVRVVSNMEGLVILDRAR